MRDKISTRKGVVISLLITFSLIYLVFGCAPAPTKKPVPPVVEERPAEIQSINIISDPQAKEATIEITSSRVVPYAAFKLAEPLRLVVGINALPVQTLTGPAVINGKIVKDVYFEITEEKPVSTRVIATLSQDVEYNVQEEDRTIRLFLSPKIQVAAKAQVAAKPIEEEEIGPKEPRRFFSPGKTKLNEILGIDFFMLPKGKSRVTVTTSKKAKYELSRKNTLALLLNIKQATIIPELTRYIDSSQFEGAVSRITPVVKVAEKRVDLEIALKEMVPYHLMQTEKELRLDFNKTSLRPPAKKITPTKLVKAPVKPEEPPPEVAAKPEEVPPAVKPTVSPPPAEVAAKPEEMPPVVKPLIKPPRPPKKVYTGARMTMDFADADVRNILKLIGEVSKWNIVWGAEVKGRVSMRLKDVPWDQALDVVLEANDLGKRKEDNIIWVTTREKIKLLEQEKEDKRKAQLDRIQEEQDARKRAKELEKELEPLKTEYIAVDFADANKIKDHIPLTEERGKISIDERTNTIIIKDIASIIEEAKKIVKQFDIPVKQIMIEARIVDASTSFSRDLGVTWSAIEGQKRKTSDTPWGGTPLWYPDNPDLNFPSGAGPKRYRYGGSFSTTPPTEDWPMTIGLSFARVTRGGLGGLALDARLALAETEGKVKIISAPKVIASNGEKSLISRGDIIYKEIVKADTTDIKELPATLELTVTPTVSFNNYVTMDVEVKDAKVYEDQSGKTEKRIKTKLMVRTGDTVVIGGIFKEDKAESESGIPWLKDIPILGWLFKTKIETSSRSELLIFLTPSVIERAAKKL